MKIQNDGGPTQSSLVESLREARSARTGNSRPENGAAENPGDVVELSGLASSIEAREEKISRLRAEVQSGTYSIPARAIASKMVADCLTENDKGFE